MGKADEFIKRGLIIGLAVTTIGGAALPLNTAYAATNDNAIVSIANSKHKGSTGHITNIDTKEVDWEYKTSQYIITDLEMPLSYVNPWYSKDNPDPAKAVKTYYYLGTVIYNDTDIRETAYNYGSLSDRDKEIYNELSETYNQKLKTSSAYNAKAVIVSEGTRSTAKRSEEFPLIYELITGEKFDWQYWYSNGVGVELESYSDYGKGTIGSGKVSHGVKSNYAKAVAISGYDSEIVKTYKIIKDGEARVYVKGLKQGTTTLTIKTTLNDGKTVTYKTKVTIKAANAPIKYTTEVNPLSYAAYALKKDGGNWLGYLSKNGDFYGSVGGQSSERLQIISHPKLFKEDGISYHKGGDDRGKAYDDSQYMRNFLKNCGAMDMLAAGKSEYEVFNHVTDSIQKESWENTESGNLPQRGNPGHHQTLKGYLEGATDVCEDRAAIATGIAQVLGLNWYCVWYSDTVVEGGHVDAVVVLDGKHYYAYPHVVSEARHINQGPTVTFPEVAMKHKSLADVTLEELMNGKILFDVYDPYEKASLYYKISDKYEAGRFKYGASINDEYDGRDFNPITTGTALIDYTFNLLYQGLGTGYIGDTRLITFRAGENPSWNKDEQNTITFRYSVPYMERAYFTMKKGATKQLNLVNANWSDWTPKTSNSKVATINSTGKITMTGTGTATITLTHKTISGLSIKVLVSTSSIKPATAKEKSGTFYTKDIYAEDSILPDGNTGNIIAGDYMRIQISY